MTRQIKLGWGEPDEALCEGDILDVESYKSYTICWTNYKGKYSIRWMYHKGHHLTYVIFPDGATFVSRQFISIDTLLRFIDDGLIPPPSLQRVYP